MRGLHRRDRLLRGRGGAGRGHLRHGPGRGALGAAPELRHAGGAGLRRRRGRAGGRRAFLRVGATASRSTWPWPPCLPGPTRASWPGSTPRLSGPQSRGRSRSSSSGWSGSCGRPTCPRPRAGPRRPTPPWSAVVGAPRRPGPGPCTSCRWPSGAGSSRRRCGTGSSACAGRDRQIRPPSGPVRPAARVATTAPRGSATRTTLGIGAPPMGMRTPRGSTTSPRSAAAGPPRSGRGSRRSVWPSIAPRRWPTGSSRCCSVTSSSARASVVLMEADDLHVAIAEAPPPVRDLLARLAVEEPVGDPDGVVFNLVRLAARRELTALEREARTSPEAGSEVVEIRPVIEQLDDHRWRRSRRRTGW